MSPEKLTKKILNDADFPSLKSYIIAATGLSYFLQKDEDLAGRIARRFQQVGVQECAKYRVLLGATTGAGSEFDLLVNELTIGETFFFRHTEQFDALRQVVLPKLIEKQKDNVKRTLRIWCAGCSTGAEPYTLAIILRHEYKILLTGWTIDIIGTDINRQFLARATLGHFDDWHLRSISQALKTLCFTRIEGEKGWLINEEYKKGVRFLHHNLISGQYPPPGETGEPFDIIFCRNVMIYFSPETVSTILPRFDRCLNEDGFLFLGYSEINTDLYKAFDPISFPGALLFQKKKAPKIFERLQDVPSTTAAPQAVYPSKTDVLPSTPRRPALLSPQTTPIDLDDVRHLANIGDYLAALKRVDGILLLNTMDARAHFLRGIILCEMDNLSFAEDALKKAVYLDRKFVLAHYHLALIYRKIGDSSKSARYILNVLELIRDLPDKALLAESNTLTVADLNVLIQTMKEAS